MAEGKLINTDKVVWNHTSALIASILTSASGEIQEPDTFHPYKKDEVSRKGYVSLASVLDQICEEDGV